MIPLMKNPLTVSAAALLLLLSVVDNAYADPERRSERVQFAKGATSTVIKGQVKGYHYVDYQVRAGAGQTLSVEMQDLRWQEPSRRRACA